jgi:hypothetical protein
MASCEKPTMPFTTLTELMFNLQDRGIIMSSPLQKNVFIEIFNSAYEYLPKNLEATLNSKLVSSLRRTYYSFTTITTSIGHQHIIKITKLLICYKLHLYK